MYREGVVRPAEKPFGNAGAEDAERDWSAKMTPKPRADNTCLGIADKRTRSEMAENRMERQRLALLAHDLRTPLSAMRTTAELIGQGRLDSKQRANLDLLLRSIDTLSDMTGELVAAARPGGAQSSAAADAKMLVRDIAELYRPLAEARGLGFRVVIAGEDSGVEARYSGPLRRVLSTLIDNAIKYTPAGKITVSMTVSGGAGELEQVLEIAVADTGPGIDPEEKARLFNPFVRGKAGEACGQGAGLGLWGAGQLLEGIGGTLRHANLPGGGSSFEVQVPVSRGVVRQDPTGSVEEAVPSSPLSGHFLIVDDNETNRRLMAALLESFGATFETAENGKHATEKVRSGAFDAVLLDLHMPGESGLDVAGRLAAEEGAPLPVIAVTASLEAVGDRQLRDAGFLDVLTKPLSPADLYGALLRAQEIRTERADRGALSRSAG
jgi:CheY-like chemotaxis protein